MSALEEKLKVAEERNETYVDKLKQLQDLHQQQADQHRNEMAAQSRLSNIYKIASQENDGKIQELVRSVYLYLRLSVAIGFIHQFPMYKR